MAVDQKRRAVGGVVLPGHKSGVGWVRVSDS